jgi:thioredoxin-like negative regulator of GroEL
MSNRTVTAAVALTLVLLLAPLAAGPRADSSTLPSAVSETTTEAYGLAWRSSYAPAMKEARQTGRPLLVVFYTTWCTFCPKMHHDTLESPTLAPTLTKFVLAMVDAEADLVAEKWFHPNGFPVVIVVDPQGQEIVRWRGYQPPQTFGPGLAAVSRDLPELSRLLHASQSGGGDARRDALTELGDLLSRANLHAQAQERYEAAVKKAAKKSAEREALLEKAASSALAAGNAGDAVRNYERLLDEFPDGDRTADRLLGLGRALLADGKDAKARSVLGRIESEHNGTPQAAEAGQLLSRPPEARPAADGPSTNATGTSK